MLAEDADEGVCFTNAERHMTVKVGCRHAAGYRFSCVIRGVGLTVEKYVLKEGAEIWYLESFMRTEQLAESLKVWEGFLASVRFS